MAKAAVIYWTGTGNTEQMAELIAEGIKEAGSEAEVLQVSDTDVDSALAFDALALGCPAMGDEELEDGEFAPFYDELKEKLGDKPVVIFGSYSWNDGEWMQKWQDDAKDAGLNLKADGLAVFEAPDEDDEVESCKQLGSKLVG